MDKHVEIITRSQVFSKFIFKIEEIKLRYMRYNGQMSAEITRLNLDRGDSVALVVHDRTADTVFLVEQFRASTYDKGPGWIVELPAGVVGNQETPDAAMARELEEEVGYRVEASTFQHISTFYVSPGGTSERIHLYYAAVQPANKVSEGGGLEAEHEDIKVLTISVSDALQMIQTGQIVDAKTIIGLQWLALQRNLSKAE